MQVGLCTLGVFVHGQSLFLHPISSFPSISPLIPLWAQVMEATEKESDFETTYFLQVFHHFYWSKEWVGQHNCITSCLCQS